MNGKLQTLTCAGSEPESVLAWDFGGFCETSETCKACFASFRFKWTGRGCLRLGEKQ